MKKYKLEITVFICGALIMVLELIAARVLSPYVGSSNLVWTTIIGIILISMSLGYWYGGKIADKKQDINFLAIFILIASVTISFIPILEVILIDYLSKLSNNLILVSIICTIITFGIPSFMLATCSPIAVKLKNIKDEQIGKISGKISSLSTIGSITGTFLAGFILIPILEIDNIILITSLILLALSIILYRNKVKKDYIIIIISIILIFGLSFYGRYIFKNNNPEIVEDLNSQYSRIWVKNISVGENSYKTLQVDTAMESYIDQNTGKMGAEYLYYYDLFDYYNKNVEDVLMIGGAAYTYPMHFLENFKDKKIDVVEIDETMTKIAEKQFRLNVGNDRLKIFHQDGRSFLNYNDKKYDAILIDAFKGINIPFELTTYEALRNAKNNLNENGVVITNIISSLEGKESDLINYEYSTYKKVFNDVKLYQVKDIEKSKKQNLILLGIKGNVNIKEEVRNKYLELLNTEILDFKSTKSFITDNYAPIF